MEGIYQGIRDGTEKYLLKILLTLYSLEAHGWKWDSGILGNKKGIYPEDEGSAFGTVLSVLTCMSQTDETPLIREEFLRRHDVKLKEKCYTF